MHKVTRAAVLAAGLLFSCSRAYAGVTSGVDFADASARAAGNDKVVAIRIGERLFAHQWAAQVLHVYANRAGTHRVAGLVLSGVKFHRPLDRRQFVAETVALIGESFAAAPVEEVDLWCIVPLSVGKGVVVNGDLAQPTQRTVFSVSVHAGESPRALAARITAGKLVYWDTLWVRQALRGR